VFCEYGCVGACTYETAARFAFSWCSELHTYFIAAQDLASAKEYVDFILAALGNKPTFAYLQVSVKRYWEQMAWLGPENWGAIPLRVPAPPEEALDLTEGMDEEVEDVSAGECIYNLIHHL
jgi:hypothetical protein